jgi:hypothetical protein
VGSGRCGTTLLRRLLQASPTVHIPPENWSFGGGIAAFRQYRWVLSWKPVVDLFLGRHAMENHRWFDEPPSELRGRLLKLPEDQRSFARLLDEIYRYHGECRGAAFERWGDKTPLNVGCMDDIVDVFPRARFIHLLRDGVDVVHSLSGMEQYAGEMVAPAHRWKRAATAARQFSVHRPSRLLEVRYERLCREPEEVLRRVCQFVDLSYEADMLSRTSHYDEMEEAQSVSHYEKAFEAISTDSIGKGRRNLNAAQKKEVAPLLNDTLIRKGYEPVDV